MGLKKLSGKVDAYNDRVKAGKTGKIKPEDVEKVRAKLVAKEAALVAEIAEAENPAKIPRLERKLTIAREHIARADWLLGQIGAPTDAAQDEPARPDQRSQASGE